jgi:hypothetical protein
MCPEHWIEIVWGVVRTAVRYCCVVVLRIPIRYVLFEGNPGAFDVMDDNRHTSPKSVG